MTYSDCFDEYLLSHSRFYLFLSLFQFVLIEFHNMWGTSRVKLIYKVNSSVFHRMYFLEALFVFHWEPCLQMVFEEPAVNISFRWFKEADTERATVTQNEETCSCRLSHTFYKTWTDQKPPETDQEPIRNESEPTMNWKHEKPFYLFLKNISVRILWVFVWRKRIVNAQNHCILDF